MVKPSIVRKPPLFKRSQRNFNQGHFGTARYIVTRNEQNHHNRRGHIATINPQRIVRLTSKLLHLDFLYASTIGDRIKQQSGNWITRSQSIQLNSNKHIWSAETHNRLLFRFNHQLFHELWTNKKEHNGIVIAHQLEIKIQKNVSFPLASLTESFHC